MTTLLLLILAMLAQSQATMLNIHLPLRIVNNSSDLCTYTHALRANLFLKQAFPSTEEISFMRLHSPHLTLFLSDFIIDDESPTVNVTSLLHAAKTAIQHHLPCTIYWQEAIPVIHGAYAMYPIQKTKCLQSLSNQLVRALQPYITRPQPIPDWVKDLPLMEKLQKIYLIKKFGSPNVFGAYDPHVTVGYDEITSPEDRLDVIKRITTAEDGSCHATVATVQIATVGVGGSVLQQGVVARIDWLPEHDATDSISGLVWANKK